MSQQSIHGVDVNTASREELMQLPSIGEKMADRLIENRPFDNWDQIDAIAQIDGKRLDEIKHHLRLGSSEQRRQ